MITFRWIYAKDTIYQGLSQPRSYQYFSRLYPMLIEEKLGYALTGASAELHDELVVDAGKKKIVKSFVQRGLIGHGPSFSAIDLILPTMRSGFSMSLPV